MFEYVSFPVFLISLAIGLFYVYVISPAPHVIVVYPTPGDTLTAYRCIVMYISFSM
jgi:hypothetical protein